MITSYKFFTEKINIFLDKIINRSKLDNTLNEDSYKDETNIAFRTILKNIGENNYIFIDSENSITAYFDIKIKDYMDKHIPTFLSNQDIPIFVKKSNFDILFEKGTEITSKVILIITEFEFIFNEIVKSESNKEYEDVTLSLKEKNEVIKNNINSLDQKFGEEKTILLSDIKLNELFKLSDYLEEKKKTILTDNPVQTDLDYKSLYYSQPSQLNKTKKDFSDYSRIDMNFLNKKRKNEGNSVEEDNNVENGEKGEEKVEEKKEIKKSGENAIPTEILNLIEKNKDKPALKADTFEEYTRYRNLSLKWD